MQISGAMDVPGNLWVISVHACIGDPQNFVNLPQIYISVWLTKTIIHNITERLVSETHCVDEIQNHSCLSIYLFILLFKKKLEHRKEPAERITSIQQKCDSLFFIFISGYVTGVTLLHCLAPLVYGHYNYLSIYYYLKLSKPAS